MINYLILVHKDLSQLNRMLSQLDHPSSRFFIHIDKKVSSEEIKKHGVHFNERVTIIKNRISINWGGFSMVMATLRLMRAAINHQNKGYFILLSGQDFPLKSNDYIHNFFSDSYGKEYLDYSPLPRSDWKYGGMNRLDYHWIGDMVDPQISDLFIKVQMQNNIIRPYFEHFPPYGGSQWWCLTYECVIYILKFIQYNPIIMEYFRTTFCSDEIFFQTIVLNSHFKEQIVNDNQKYIVWQEHASHPKTMTINDFDSLIKSGKLWGRKFDINHDSSILDKIESYLHLCKN